MMCDLSDILNFNSFWWKKLMYYMLCCFFFVSVCEFVIRHYSTTVLSSSTVLTMYRLNDLNPVTV